MVSIHAPARGATMVPMFSPKTFRVSIHAPARGATIIVTIYSILYKFQSTRPRGARQEKDELGVRIAIVSIHAPARGATFSCFIICFIVCVSIHAPARGATRDSQARIDSKNEFQSTRPRGARRKRGVVDAVLDGFQSTRPRGARPIVSYNVFSKSKVSIHAPARGATLYIPLSFNSYGSFNPRARAGRDLLHAIK